MRLNNVINDIKKTQTNSLIYYISSISSNKSNFLLDICFAERTKLKKMLPKNASAKACVHEPPSDECANNNRYMRIELIYHTNKKDNINAL